MYMNRQSPIFPIFLLKPFKSHTTKMATYNLVSSLTTVLPHDMNNKFFETK